MTTAVAGRQLEQQREQLSFCESQQQQPEQREQQHRFSLCAALSVAVSRIEEPEAVGLEGVRRSEHIHSSSGFRFPRLMDGTKTHHDSGVGSDYEGSAVVSLGRSL
jgi:hypothetical protein